jgi:antitoxin component of MazEF toxin-antitoxin module
MGVDLEVKVRKWGNSFGLLVSKKDASRLGIRENQKLRVKIEEKVSPLRELFGAKLIKRPTKTVLKEARDDFSKWGL